MSENWNLKFTDLLRGDHPTFWGNWSLDTDITPGAVGTLNSDTGSLKTNGSEVILPGLKVGPPNMEPVDWQISSTNVHVTTVDATFDGSTTDPDTGTKLTLGLEAKWSFASEGSISSTFTVSHQSSLGDISEIEKNLDWLKQQADAAGMLSNGIISQGFGVVTAVYFVSCGANVGSKSTKSTFSMSGSAEGINAMTGKPDTESDADSKTGKKTNDVKAKGAYVSTNENGNFETVLYPSKAGELATGVVPIAFRFASYVGDQLLDGWITNVADISIVLANNHWGTYIVTATATYDVNGKSQSCSAKVSGGLCKTMDPIPVNARDLNLKLTFEANKTIIPFIWGSPLAQFPTGNITIDIHGVSPGDPSASAH